jgi:NHL repeat
MKRSMTSAVRHRLAGIALAGLVCAALLPVLLSGCGEKIAIPEPSGVWANLAYSIADTFDEVGVRQVTTGWGNLFVLTADSLTKRNLDYLANASVSVPNNPTSMCVDKSGELIFVWEETGQTVSVFDSTELEFLGSAHLPELTGVISMATSPEGMDETIAGGRTFLYLTTSDGLIYRHAVMGAQDGSFTCAECLLPAGLLAWYEGVGARSVHSPAGLARDSEDQMLVCERDSLRNWVIRFDSAPDSTDLTAVPPDGDPAMAGRAVTFGQPTCEPEPAAEDYVLGDAAECDEAGWVGGSSSADGEFDLPLALAVDGEGKIFVADFNNSRIQIFDANGDYRAQFGIRSESGETNPTSLGIVDIRIPSGLEHNAAFVFVTVQDGDRVIKYISEEHYLEEFGELPPYEE